MAVKIKLKRIGKIRVPQYRIVIADSRTARNGRAIEEVGIYQPKQEPSLIRVDSERVQYWLSVGAQPTEPVMALLKVTGASSTVRRCTCIVRERRERGYSHQGSMAAMSSSDQPK